jgi:hypothetical protein
MKAALWLSIALCAAPALAQPPALAAADCPGPADLQVASLYGLWQLRLWPVEGQEGSPESTGALLFEPHPEYPGSVRGLLKRAMGHAPDALAQVAGDVIDGEFNLDESADGTTMDAVWTGVPQNCGRHLRGQRHAAEGRGEGLPVLNFLLQKVSGAR